MKQNKSLGKFFGKCALLLIPEVALFLSLCIYTDIFNVFHPNTIRDTSAMPNERFLKMKYLLSHPKEKNALIFGSSRVGNIPTAYLNDNTELRWYNMTYSTGVIEEHLKDIEILIENNMPIQKIMIVFDDVSFEITAKAFHSDLMRKAYCEYIRLGNRFYLPYLMQFDFGIFRQVLAGNVKTEHFYGIGDNIRGEEEFLPGEEKEHPAFRERPYTVPFDVLLEQIKSIKKLCEDNGIEVLFVTNPLWKNTFIYSCSDGYLDFLRQVAEITPFLNFSCLNEITHKNVLSRL